MAATSIFALILAVQAAPVPLAPPPMVRPPPPPPALGAGGAPQRVRAHLAAYFSGDDYPAAALRAKEEGMVGFRLAVAADGRVAGCVVTSSSGFASLDAATCRILRSRARYNPARDSRGLATTGTDSGRVRWQLPDEPFDPNAETEPADSAMPVAVPKPPWLPRPDTGSAPPRTPPK